MTGHSELSGRGDMNRRSTRFTLPWLSALAAVIAISGCSISSDDAPRALAVATTTTEAPSTATSGGTAAVLYYVRDGKLVPVTRSLPDRRIGVVLNALLQSPDQSATPVGVGTSLPTGTTLKRITENGNMVEVDLSKEFENVVGPSREQAIAQLVMTATEFPDVDSMRFTIDGKPLQVTSRSRGDTSSVGDCDFATLLASSDDAQEAKLPASTIERLDLRRRELAQTCPVSTQTTG